MAAPIVSFKDIWTAFMCDPPVREWLFNRSPLSRTEAWECVTNHPEPLSFSFDASAVQVTGAENLHDFAQLSTVLYHVGGVALGVTFGNGNKQPVLPMAKALNNDPEFEDNVAIVRRCAIRRYSPRSRHLVRLQADWFRSGCLGFDFAFIPADNPDVHPSVGFAIFGYRAFKKSEAAALYQAAMYPSKCFLDGTTPLLTPADGYITLDACDSQFQTPCIFCASRNTVLCYCPAPLRRRVEHEGSSDGMIQALTTNTGESDSSDEAVKEMVWHYFAHRMKSSINSGTFLTNWRYERPSVPGMSHVLVTHVIPYALLFNNTGAQTPIVQRAITALGLGSKHPQTFAASSSTHFPLSITGRNAHDNASSGNNANNINTYHHGSLSTAFHARKFQSESPFYHHAVVQEALVDDDNIVPYHKARQSSLDSIPTLDLVSNQPPQHPYHTMQNLHNHHHQNMQNTQNHQDIAHIASSLFDHNMNNILLPTSPTPPKHPSTADNTYHAVPPPVENGNSIDNSMGSSHSLPVSMLEDLMISENVSPDAEKMNMNMKAPAPLPMPLSVPIGVSVPTEADANGNNSSENGRRKRQKATGTAKRAGVAKKETRQWQCDQCPAVIRGKRSNLTRHKQNKHAKVRAFRCKNCPKRFQTRLNLVRHQKLVHEGRPFLCGSCPRSFKTQEKLQKHLDGVHAPGISTLACPLCNGCYGKRSTLSRHITSVHRALSDVSDETNGNANGNNGDNGNGHNGNGSNGNGNINIGGRDGGNRNNEARGTLVQNGTTKTEDTVPQTNDAIAKPSNTNMNGNGHINGNSNMNMNATHLFNVINLHHDPMQVPVPVSVSLPVASAQMHPAPFMQRPSPQQQQTPRGMVM